MAVFTATKPKLQGIFKHSNENVNLKNIQNAKVDVSKITKAIFIIFGIYLCFVTSSYYQEKIPILIKKIDAHVSIPLFLISLLCLCNAVSSGLILTLRFILYKLRNKNANLNDKKNITLNFWGSLNKKAIYKLSLSSLSLTGATICSTLSLKHITFPTQVLIKSGKMVPIVLGSYLIFGKRYSFFDYLIVLIITTSLIFFNLFGSIAKKNTKQTILGIFLCCLSLIFDSYTGPSQEELLSWCRIDSITMMFVMNSISFIYSLVLSLYFGGIAAFNIIVNDPKLSIQVFYYTISASLGQFFVYLSINEFGSLYTCTITTTRKAVTTLVSIYFFGHSITNIQWVCIFTIFTTLLTQQYYKYQSKLKKL